MYQGTSFRRNTYYPVEHIFAIVVVAIDCIWRLLGGNASNVVCCGPYLLVQFDLARESTYGEGSVL